MKRNTLLIALAGVALALWYFVFRKGAITQDAATGASKINLPGGGSVAVPKFLSSYITPDVANNVNKGVTAAGTSSQPTNWAGLASAAAGLVKSTGLDKAIGNLFTKDVVGQSGVVSAANPNGWHSDWGTMLGGSSYSAPIGPGLNDNDWAPATSYSSGGSFWGSSSTASEPSNYVLASSGNGAEDY